MRQIAEDKQLPADIEAEPLVRAAAALQPVIRSHRDEIDREQRLPKTLVEQFHAAGFYNMTIPRELGGLQVDPLTYLRVVELLAEAAGSVGWNLCNNSIAQLVTLGLPDEGVLELYSQRPDTPIAGTAVMGGGRAVAVDRERVEHLVAAEPNEHGALLAAVGAVRRFDLAGRREPERPPAHGRRLDDVEGRLSIDKSPILGTRRSPLASAGGSCRPPLPGTVSRTWIQAGCVL